MKFLLALTAMLSLSSALTVPVVDSESHSEVVLIPRGGSKGKGKGSSSSGKGEGSRSSLSPDYSPRRSTSRPMTDSEYRQYLRERSVEPVPKGGYRNTRDRTPEVGDTGIYTSHERRMNEAYIGDKAPVHAQHLQYAEASQPRFAGLGRMPYVGERASRDAPGGTLYGVPRDTGLVREEKPYYSLQPYPGETPKVSYAPNAESVRTDSGLGGALSRLSAQNGYPSRVIPNARPEVISALPPLRPLRGLSGVPGYANPQEVTDGRWSPGYSTGGGPSGGNTPVGSPRGGSPGYGGSYRDRGYNVVDTQKRRSASPRDSPSYSKPYYPKRDVIGQLNGGETTVSPGSPASNASTQANDVELYLALYDYAMASVTAAIIPVINDLLNDTNSDYIFEIALSIYTMANPAILYSGPYVDGMTSYSTQMNQTYNVNTTSNGTIWSGTVDNSTFIEGKATNGPLTNGTALSAFTYNMYQEIAFERILTEIYEKAYNDAYTAANSTGLMDDLEWLNYKLAQFDLSAFPPASNETMIDANLPFFFQGTRNDTFSWNNYTVTFTDSNLHDNSTTVLPLPSSSN